MSDAFYSFEKRKQDHIQLALSAENQASEQNVFEQITLMHEAIPDFDFSEISIASNCLGKKTPTPFLVSSMTAGHEKAIDINRNLMAAASAQGWIMGVGSQRRELTDADAASEWKKLRGQYPDVSLLSNIGISQLITARIDDVMRLVENIQAVGLIVHCNPLQECIQPEGTPEFKGSWLALEQLAKLLPVPVIVKETGCGFSRSTCERLANIGIKAIDVSGLGGTHWGRIEGHRATDLTQQQAAKTFKNWGVNTIDSVLNAQDLDNYVECWGSGGVRNGLDAAKLLALGVNVVGFAKPMLLPALESADTVIQAMQVIEYELKVAMFCSGSQVVPDLQEKICL